MKDLVKKFKNHQFRTKVFVVITSILFLLGSILPYVSFMFQ